jgi:hypothetical protein
MLNTILSGLSAAALSIVARLVTKEVFEKILIMLIKRGASYLASKTENTTDDEIVAEIIKRLDADTTK